MRRNLETNCVGLPYQQRFARKTPNSQILQRISFWFTSLNRTSYIIVYWSLSNNSHKYAFFKVQHIGLSILTSIILCRSAIRGTFALQSRITVPVGSSPLRPARPAIWMYSPDKRSRKAVPSCFLIESNTTVLAGMLTPIANVSVANRIWKQIVSSLKCSLRYVWLTLRLISRMSKKCVKSD